MQTTPAGQHVILRVVLFLFAIIEVVAGLLLLFAAGPIVALAPATLGLAHNFGVTVLLIFGILALGFGYLLFVASKDPVRYVAVIDTLIFLCVAAVCVDLYATLVLQVLAFPSVGLLVTRELVRLGLAVLLFVLRPRRSKTLRST